jgi:hypothetical protein
MLIRTLILTLLPFTAQAGPRKCLGGLLEQLSNHKTTLSKAEDLPSVTKFTQLQTLKEAELKPMVANLQEAYKKGGELQELRYRLMTLQNSPQTAEVIQELKQIESTFARLRSEITVLNDDYLNSMHAIYQREGIPSQLLKADDGALVLKLDFSAAPSDARAFEFYRRIKNKFGLNEVTLSLKDNAENGSAGFFMPSVKRIEMGPQQGFSMLEDYFNSVSKHESRHSMFANKRVTGDDSIFHVQFHASQKGHLLNSDKVYDSYMSSEELYTFSTDLQSLGQALNRNDFTNAKATQSLLAQITESNEMFRIVSKSTKSVTQDMLTALDELTSQQSLGTNLGVIKRNDGSLNLTFADKLGRQTQIVLVNSQEKADGIKFLAAQQKLSELLDRKVTELFHQSGGDVAGLVQRFNSNQATAEDIARVQEFSQQAMKTSEVQLQLKQMQSLGLPLIKNARENMHQLNRLADIQLAESGKILKQLEQLKTAPTIDLTQVQPLKDNMFKLAKNVKEDYKGFALTPQKSP